MPYCGHAHIKDARMTREGYFFTPLGEGDIGCDRIVQTVARTKLDLSVEIPLRLHRGSDARPVRRPDPVPRAEIESVLRAALAFVESHLQDPQDQ
jgi:sugar phosphate isomerase/epimerase